MIRELQFHSGYPTQLPGIGKKRISFNDRVNILFGPNGSGKTTILRTLAVASGCGMGGWSNGSKGGALHELPYTVNIEKDFVCGHRLILNIRSKTARTKTEKEIL